MTAHETAQRFQTESLQHAESLSKLLAEASTLVHAGRAGEALQLYRTGRQNLQAFDDKWDAELRRGEPSFAEWWRQYVREQEASLLEHEGLALRWMGRPDDAGHLFERALVLTPAETYNHASLLHSLGGIHFDKQAFAEAEDLYRQAHAEYTTLAAKVERVDSDPESASNNAGLFRRQAAQALADGAYAALSRGSHADFERSLEEAISFAKEHEFLDLEDKLWLKQVSFLLGNDASGEIIEKVKAEKEQRCSRRDDPEFRVEALQLIAGFYIEQGSFRLARVELERDLKKATDGKIAPLPLHRQWTLLRQLADIAEAQGDTGAAHRYSQDALAIARQLNMPQIIIASLRALVSLHAENDPDEAERCLAEVRAFGVMDEIKNALLARATIHLKHKRFELAMQDVDEAERATPGDAVVLLTRVGVLRGMDAKEETLRAIERAATAFREQLRRSGADWKSGFDSLAALHEAAAFVTAELGRTDEAFVWVESGKALRLRSRFSEPTNDAETTDISFSILRERLRAESATLLYFSVMQRGTLALLCDSRFDKPQAFFFDLTEQSLAKLFPPDKYYPAWNKAVFDALGPLSEKLAPCLNAAINCKEHRVLYIVPDAQLYFLPFAALNVGQNSKLIDHCAIAYLPCGAMLTSSSQAAVKSRTCLAVGSGKAGEANEYQLAEQAAEIAALRWDAEECIAEAKVQEFLDRAPQFCVLHFACHGQMEGRLPTTRSASFLKLSDRPLTAKDIYNLSLSSELVFLNACVSGRFQSRLSNEVGGFWEAFLNAGASRIIVTVTYVHPESAQRLALAFYRHWLSGLASAEALRQAQFEMRQEKPEPEHWATHILIGVG